MVSHLGKIQPYSQTSDYTGKVAKDKRYSLIQHSLITEREGECFITFSTIVNVIKMFLFICDGETK